MQQPPREKITVSWDDVNSPQVDAKLKQQQSSQRQAGGAAGGGVVSPALGMTQQQLKSQQRTSIWYNTPFAMAIFGLIGGLLAWGVGELVQLTPPTRAQYMDRLKEAQDAWTAVLSQRGRVEAGVTTRARAELAIAEVEESVSANPYYPILKDPSLNQPQRNAAVDRQHSTYETQLFIAKILAYGLVGMLIALALAIAEPLIDRNMHAVYVNGAVGAGLGLFGGVVVSLFVDQLHRALGGNESTVALSSFNSILADAIKYGVIGLFLTVAPGIILRNLKKMGVGLAGGLIGGLIGGCLFAPVAKLTGNQAASRAIALVAIGSLAGIATGLIENVAKTGWMKVLQGLIAGKQFILYRATTFIGSAPDCHIYLFKDVQVGRRHAAIHIVPGGFDLEDLPLGTPTFVNGKPITRQRLRTGDQIQVGSTIFSFQEKVKA